MNWSQIKRELKGKDKAELVDFLKRLFDLNEENRSFLKMNLSGHSGEPSDYYKREISDSVSPGIDSPIDLRRGRKAIASYKKAAPQDRWGQVSLMMYFVEQGALFTLEFGDIDSRFYDSMSKIIDSIFKLSTELSSVEFAHLAKRFEALDSITENQIGWGFSDHISEINAGLRSMIH